MGIGVGASRSLEQLRGGAMPKLRHVQSFDGFRAAAVLVVMVYHLGLPPRGGHVGVNAFFVLSGFLITSLLLREFGRSGRIALGRFYLRRVLRLFPPLLAVIAVVTLYSLLVPGAIRSDDSLRGALPAFFYFSNWVRAFSDHGNPLGLYEHTWSLSVEEQFYILWPLVLLLILKLTRRMWAAAIVAALGCGASLVIRCLVDPGVHGTRIYNGFDTQADQLLFGCALATAVLLAEVNGWAASLGKYLAAAMWPALLIIAAATLTWRSGSASPSIYILMTVTAAAFAITVGALYLNPASLISRLLSWSPLVYVGKRSYALYLWHYPIFTVMHAASIPESGPLRMLLQLLLSFVAAELSWRLIEKPAGKLKARFSS